MADNKAEPLGAKTEDLWRALRIVELTEALARYRAKSVDITQGMPLRWAAEIGRHADWLVQRENVATLESHRGRRG